MILKLGTTVGNLILMPLGGATGAYLRTAILGFWAPYTPHSKSIVDFEGFWRIFEDFDGFFKYFLRKISEYMKTIGNDQE